MGKSERGRGKSKKGLLDVSVPAEFRIPPSQLHAPTASEQTPDIVDKPQTLNVSVPLHNVKFQFTKP
jgi:hypothetical protein